MSETVKVRICVAVSADGKWHAAGWSDTDDGQIAAEAEDFIPTPFEHPIESVWIEAEIPLPQETTVQGKVVDD